MQYAVMLLMTAGLFFVLRQWRWCAAATILLCVNGWWLAPFLLSEGATVDRQVDAGSPSFTLASINVYSGNPTPERVVEFVQQTNPDIVVVLEVTPAWEHRLGALSSSHPYSAVQSNVGNFGIAIYSRWPLQDIAFSPMSESNEAISTRIEIEGASIQIVAVHPFPPMGARG
ncbi:MAG: endonuclease/exonuclease/phosphatase family protein, partial [Planctomycetaceae bacterium]|nr:endonuclease/exonuclease/phosphatase family protein [Planctomycetaceae bacterium]